MKLLIIEDERELSNSIVTYLSSENLRYSNQRVNAINYLIKSHFDVIH